LDVSSLTNKLSFGYSYIKHHVSQATLNAARDYHTNRLSDYRANRLGLVLDIAH